jgi:uncharacterized cupin superfamily protein
VRTYIFIPITSPLHSFRHLFHSQPQPPYSNLTMGALLSKVKSNPASEKPATKMSSPTPFTHYAGAQAESFQKLPLIANDNAFLGDTSTSTDPTAPISAGFYRLEKGTPLVYDYTYHEMKIIVDGEFDISDETGQKVHAVKGDVFYCE